MSRLIILQTKGFRCILAVPAGAAAADVRRGMEREATVQGTRWCCLCRDVPSQPIEPNSLLLRQTLRVDR